jgi:hypothetical protein
MEGRTRASQETSGGMMVDGKEGRPTGTGGWKRKVRRACEVKYQPSVTFIRGWQGASAAPTGIRGRVQGNSGGNVIMGIG